MLEKAYNDSRGITAAFNKNILTRLNREFQADFDLDSFRHQAVYNSQAARIEMFLISTRDQKISIAGRSISFREGGKDPDPNTPINTG